jgi:hypothetical protein
MALFVFRPAWYVWGTFALAGCPQNPPVPPNPDASDAAVVGDAPPNLDDCQRGCAALAAPAVACPIGGDASDCAGYLRTLNDLGKEPNPANGNRPLKCSDVAKVRSKSDARSLGFACP